MVATSRRNLLAMVALAVPAVQVLTTGSAGAADAYPSNTALYAETDLVEGVDYARRYQRHRYFDESLPQRYPYAKTTILAPHGGGIEVGTSELCLAVAGYHPASLAVTPAGGTTHDYWMFEGLRASNNGELHVTSSHCDDGVARSLCAGALNALGLHGCTAAQAGEGEDTAAVLVGGRNNTFKQYLLEELTSAGFRAIDAVNHESLNGNDPDNIANRTLLGAGGQLEITTPLRLAMFEVNTRAQRKNTTTPLFWSFVAAVRTAITRTEAGQVIA
ncbi:poly-gamma-glutamate hydrolase family protein [Micromonospora sp. NPDC004704]